MVILPIWNATECNWECKSMGVESNKTLTGTNLGVTKKHMIFFSLGF